MAVKVPADRDDLFDVFHPIIYSPQDDVFNGYPPVGLCLIIADRLHNVGNRRKTAVRNELAAVAVKRRDQRPGETILSWFPGQAIDPGRYTNCRKNDLAGGNVETKVVV